MLWLQEIIERVLGYSVDWSATAAWAQAIMSGGAVFFAARLAEKSAFRTAQHERYDRGGALLGLYQEALETLEELADAFTPGHKGVTPVMPTTGELDELIAVLSAVPILELDGWAGANELFRVRRAVRDGRGLFEQFGTLGAEEMGKLSRSHAQMVERVMNERSDRLAKKLNRTKLDPL